MAELITIVDLLQPQCSLTYGSAPCAAQIGVTGSAKCYNTRATCQDPANYDPDILRLRFCEDQEGMSEYGYVLPSLRGMSIAPLMINLAGMDSGASPFGQRDTCSLQLDDFLHSDLLVDKYRTERSASGTFWGRWLARNPYFESMQIEVHQGVRGQAVEDMETRHYVIDRISGPSDGRVTMVAKDLFSRVESRKALAPKASRCELRIGFESDHGGTFEAVPAELADTEYPVGEFYIAINDEILLVDRPNGSSVIDIVERGALGTEAEKHDAGDKVQLVLTYTGQQAQAIVADLLENYAGIDPSYIPISDWNTEMAARPELLSAHIAEPTPVETLVGELCEQIGFSVWPDVVDNEIKLAVLQPDNNPLPIVTDNDWMLEGSYSSRRMIEQRVSQVWVYYGQRNPLESQSDPVNYRARRVFADPSAEGADQYGSPAIKEVFSRWIPQFAGNTATQTGDRILSLFRDPPLRIQFDLHRSREGELSVADQFSVQTRDEQSDDGVVRSRTFAPIQLSRSAERIRVTAQQISFFFGEATDRTLLIESVAQNYNIRDTYSLIYGTPPDGERVTVRVLNGVTVGSDDPADPAMNTGSWPPNVELRIEIESGARIVGAGGNGGAPGFDGVDGGTGLFVAAPVYIDNLGTIAGGGGGGGGALDTVGDLTASASGGGGAGVDPGTGNEPGTDTTGGPGGFQQIIGPGVEPVIVIANGGNGGDLGQPGGDGFAANSLGTIGGAAGAAIDGTGLVFFDNVGTIIGNQIDEEDTVFFPPPVAPDNLSLTTQLVLLSTGQYGTLLVFTFDRPDDDRIISFEAQYQLGRDGTTWRNLYDSYNNRHEWNSAEIGQFRVRVRSVYLRGRIYSAWVSADIVTLGTYTQIASIGINPPIDPLLYITNDPDRPLAQIRITAGFDQTGIIPDRFLLFYSALNRVPRLTITEDAGSKLYLSESGSIAGLFNLTVASGSTSTAIRYEPSPGIDIDLVTYWWASVRNEPGSPSRYYKIARSSETTLTLSYGDELPFTPDAGQLIDMAELEWADGRLPEFRLLYVNGEVIRHNGINFDGRYYLDVAERGAEGTTQANQSGRIGDYYPAPGPLTIAVEIPASSFREVDGVFEVDGEIPVSIPADMVWASVTCCLARDATEGESVQLIRSPIVPLVIAGPAA